MNKRPGIVLFAYSEVGALCLEQLIKDGANILCLFTHEDDPEEEIWFRSVAEIARRKDIPVYTPKKLAAAEISHIKALAPELVLSFYYRALIPAEILALPRLGAFNMHGALLPKYRGRACVNWAVLNGERETGATLHLMTEKADRGDIIDQEKVPILFTDTGHDVFLKVAEAAKKIMARTLPLLETGRAPRTPQNEAEATYFGRRRPEDGKIDWNKSAVEIYNLIRAVAHPFPGAFTEFNGKKIFIWKALPLPGKAEPQQIIAKRPLTVGTGNGLLKIISLQPEGGAEREEL